MKIKKTRVFVVVFFVLFLFLSIGFVIAELLPFSKFFILITL